MICSYTILIVVNFNFNYCQALVSNPIHCMVKHYSIGKFLQVDKRNQRKQSPMQPYNNFILINKLSQWYTSGKCFSLWEISCMLMNALTWIHTIFVQLIWKLISDNYWWNTILNPSDHLSSDLVAMSKAKNVVIGLKIMHHFHS